MDAQERKLDYEKSAHEFWRWILTGEQLLQAAYYLYGEYSAAMASMQKQQSGKMPNGADMLAPMLFLRASSLENLIKGLYIKNGNTVTDGNGTLDFKNHKFIDLCEQLLSPLSDERREVIEKLTESIYFWGRYPVPTKYEYWRHEIPELTRMGITGIPPIFFWSGQDEKVYLEILGEIRQMLKDQTKGKKAPAWFGYPD